jgi:hypothetical protein
MSWGGETGEPVRRPAPFRAPDRFGSRYPRWRLPDAPRRQAGGRPRPRLVSTTADRRTAIESALAAGSTGHGGLEPRRTATTLRFYDRSWNAGTLATALSIVAPFIRALLPGVAAPGAVGPRGKVAGSPGSNAPASHTTRRLPFAVRADALVMAFAGSPPRLPHLPPYHDVEALHRAKLPVRAAVDPTIRSATGVHCSACGASHPARWHTGGR